MTVSTHDRPSSASARTGLTVPPTWMLVVGVLAIWVAIWSLTRGSQTLALPGLGKTDVHDWLTDRRSDLIAGRDTNLLMQTTGVLADVFNAVVEWLQALVAKPEFPRPVPEIGWLGVVALAAWVAFAVASWQMAVLVTGSFLAFGYLGYWEDSLDTLIITFFSVGLALLVGIPLAVWMATSSRVTSLVTPVLDVLQTLPSFCYLLPVVLFFGISAPSAVVATLLYALPPVIRIAAHGIRSVSPAAMEATDSLGQTRRQRMTKVQLPLAKRTIIVGVNQTTMAALSMTTIAALVNGPGLGEPVLSALSAQAVGAAFVAGLCIVIVAVMLDRVTTAASERSERVTRAGHDPRQRRVMLVATGIAALGLVYLSRTYSALAQFPESSIGPTLAERVQSWTESLTSVLGGVTTAFKNQVSALLLNPMQDLLANSPWWLAGLAILALSVILAGARASLTTLVCLTLIYVTDLWHDAMITLTMTFVGTVLVMVLAVVFGVWMARSRALDAVVRPVLDAAQVMPPFVYLIPVLAFFDVTRFSAIVAGVVFAAPVAIKLVADGIRAVPATTVEAAVASGSSTWQTITKVQLPMARGSLVLAANQGLLYVLSMAVIGGLVGAGALGYDVVLGFSQGDYYGKGLAAGAAIVALGIMLDRIARSAAATSTDRGGRSPTSVRPTGNVKVRAEQEPGSGPGNQPVATKGCEMARGPRRSVWPGVAVCATLVLSACGGDIQETEEQNEQQAASGGGAECGELNLAVHPWVGYEADAYVVGHIAETELGCDVEYKELKEELTWPEFGTGEVDVIIEDWGHPDLEKQYFAEQGDGTAMDFGPTGNQGIIGWYVVPWMAQEYPDITNWQNLNQYADMFETSESGGQGQFLGSDPSYVQFDEAIVENLDLDYKVVFSGSENASIAAFRKAEQNREPLLGYFYEPQWFFSEVPLAKVELPEYTEGCQDDAAEVDCDYPVTELKKIVSTEWAEEGSPAVDLVENFTWTNDDQNTVAGYIAVDGMSQEDAAAKWVEENPDMVEEWLS